MGGYMPCMLNLKGEITMYEYIEKDNVFTKDNMRLAFTDKQIKNLIKAGNIIKQAKSLPLKQKLLIHHQVQRVVGSGDYMACAKTYANN